jgi:hypothetical protein
MGRDVLIYGRRLPGRPLPHNKRKKAMKRDLDLCTKILVKLEGKDLNEDIDSIEGYTENEFYYNARLLAGVSLIEIRDMSDLSAEYACVATQLTWAGHDFLEKGTSPKWIAYLQEQGIDVGKDVAAGAIRTALEKLGDAIAPYLRDLF